MAGYLGKLLRVDLTNNKVEDYPLDPKLLEDFIGGAGLACRILYDLVDKDIDPLSPANPLIIMTGPLSGTGIPTAGRTEICAKSPLTKIWAETSFGGSFAAELRYAGYDGILIEGQSKNLVYLLIQDDKVEIKDASQLKGKETFATQELIREELKNDHVKVMCIGPAGEHLVKYASIVHPDLRTAVAGRTGMGALMGSKRLKAIAVQGSQKEIPVADAEKLKAQSTEIAKTTMDNFSSQMFQALGTAGYIDMANATGDLSTKYYSLPEFSEAYNISGATMQEKILLKNAGCYRCPIRCGREIEIKDGKYKTSPSKGPEYETLASLGSNLLIGDLEAISYLGLLCDRFGMDTISCGVTIAFSLHLYEKGILSKQETGNLELKWGDPDLIEKLINMIATRQGFGDILAEGTRRIAERFEISQDEVAAVNGLEIPFHDVRAYFGMAVAYATSPRGACHDQADMFLATIGNIGPGAYPWGVEATDRFQNEGKGRLAAILQDYRAIHNSLVICIFVNPPPDQLINALNYATGFTYDLDQLKRTGERIVNMKRLFNLKMGLTRKDDRLPKIVLTPLEGPLEGNVPDLDLQLSEYYAFRKWDPTTGKPSKDKLEELGLGEFISDL
jgi:aldehyde:ferredoxin oxidoreductase